MNVVDAFCKVHQQSFRWLSGTPYWCPECRKEWASKGEKDVFPMLTENQSVSETVSLQLTQTEESSNWIVIKFH